MMQVAKPWPALFLTALSMSVGWGIRGQFGHEYGAAIAGALGAMAVVLLSGRRDWLPRVSFFAVLGAIGWAFGGSMSYMKVIAYTHSPDPATVLYGFVSTFLVGFLWAAPGGGGTALAAYFTRDALTELFIPLTAVLGTSVLRDMWLDLYPGAADGLAAEAWTSLTPLLTVLVVCALRRGFSLGSRLALYLFAGRWIGYVVLVQMIGLRLNPPRGESWASLVGLVAGLLVFCYRNHLPGVTFATLMTGFVGGFGFALGQVFKLLNISTGLQTNWHSVMEQTQGFFFGLALAVSMAYLARRAPAVSNEPRVRKWTEVFAVTFVLWGITYVNFRLSPADWVRYVHTMPDQIYGVFVEAGLRPSRGFIGWFDIAYLVIGVTLAVLLIFASKRGMPVLPDNWLGRGQLLYLVFIWAVTFINFAHVLVRFQPTRLVTEFVITINAATCTLLLLAGNPLLRNCELSADPESSYTRALQRVVAAGVASILIISAAGWTIKRALFGDTTVPYSVTHIRFGPDNTNDKK